MRIIINRAVSLLLCLAMLSAVCGCSKNNSVDENTTDADVPEETAETAVITLPNTSDAQPEDTTVAEPETTAGETTFVPETKKEIIHSDSYSEETPYAPVVLTYHLIEEEVFGAYPGMFLRPEEFKDHLRVLKEEGYEFMFADEYAFSSNKCVILTFDDGYADNYTTLFPILKSYGAVATIFVITKLVGRSDYVTNDEMIEMENSGFVHIGSHTVSHNDMRDMNADQVRSELANSKAYLEWVLGKPVTAVSYPTGGFSETVTEVAAEYYNFGYTTVQQRNTANCNKMAISRLSTSRGLWGDAILPLIEG